MKTRGLKEAEIKLGNIEFIIDNMLKKKKKIKIFESGCGYGKLMMDLSKKYGNQVEITGMNLKQSHGNKKIMISLAIKKKIIKKSDLKSFNLTKMVFGDAGEKLPFKTGSIDLVLSQVSSYLYKDKLHFFEEVARILNKEGIARITPCFFMKEYPEEFKEILRIYNKGKKISVKKFIIKFTPTIKLIKLNNRRLVLEIKKGNLNFKTELISTLNYNKLNKKWFGVQSTYTINKELNKK
jgi:ubiquinone/menaquinone biosynthesis C-methylase UbiE